MQTLAQLQSGALKGAVSIKLSEKLSYFPVELFDLADTLEKLDLSQNELTELPADFGKLKKLKIFFCSDNLFTLLPAVLGDCPLLDIVGFKANKISTIPPQALNTNLRWLILTDNNIGELPKEIGLCSRMQKLMLAGNKLSSLPEELSRCRNLSLLRISANELKELPSWLLQMPKLSWLAFSGNPFSIKANNTDVPNIDWHDLHIQHGLGEGASGNIYKAVQLVEGQEHEVAVKVFKGAVTSDGLPEDEMNAFIAAGNQPGLVKLSGQIVNHPEGRKGLVMELIPAGFYNLGQPPSLASCTRDIFREGIKLSVQQIAKITATIAAVAAQLHKRGIMHGDMYAHNTLVDQEANTLFGDFGAACFYDTTDTTTAFALQRLEVSAWGCMLDDLLGLCNEDAESHSIIKLKQLRDAALAVDVQSRPDFEYLSDNMSKCS